MPNFSFRYQNKAVKPVSSAIAVQDQCRGWLEQLVLELKPERKVKGALSDIANAADLPYSKVRRIYYRLTLNICAYERDRLRVAIDRIALDQQKKIERRLETIRSLRDDRRLLENHLDLRV